MPRNLTFIFIIIGVTTIAFFLGYRYGYRDTYNQAPANIEYSQNEFGTQNSLTNIKIKPVLGPQNEASQDNFNRGFVLVKENSTTTDLKISLKNIAATIQTPEDKNTNTPAQKINFPAVLRVEAASINPVTKSLNFVELSNLTLDPMVNKSYTGDLNFSINTSDKKLQDANFIFFYDASNASQNLYQIDLKNYPNVEEAKKRPFLWVYLQ